MLRFTYVLPPAGLVLVILAFLLDLTPLAFTALALTMLGLLIMLVAIVGGRHQAPPGKDDPGGYAGGDPDETATPGVLARLRPSSAELVSIRIDEPGEVRRLADLLAEAGVHAHVRVHSDPLDVSIWRHRAKGGARGGRYELLVRPDDAYVARLLDHALWRMRLKETGERPSAAGICPGCGAAVDRRAAACPSCGLTLAGQDH